MRRIAVASLALALSPQGAAALPQDIAAFEVGEIVVTARRAGAPIWTIQRGESTLVVIGAIEGVPRDMAWRPEALEAAVGQADRILLPQQGRASLADIGRLIWRARTAATLPQGTTVSDHLSPEWVSRLAVLKVGDNDRWRRTNLLLTAMDLVREDAGFEARGGPTASTVVERAAREAKIPAHLSALFAGMTRWRC